MTDSELGAWLRQQRQAQGWPKAEMARRLVQVGHDSGDKAMPAVSGMLHNIHRWEREGGVSERHKLHYCRILGIQPGQFGLGQHHNSPDHPMPESAVHESPAAPAVPGDPSRAAERLPDQLDPRLSASAAMTYRGRHEPVFGCFTAEQEVLMAAHEASDRAEEYEQHGIGEATFEQLRADVMRLSRLSDTGSPLPAFLEMRRVRDRIYRLLDRHMWPGEQTDLHFLLGCINGLMGVTATRLGYPDAAEEMIRAGYASAVAIDHWPLRGMLRAKLSDTMYWRGWFREARDLAADGLHYVSQGPLGADLHVNHARAAARLGELNTVRQAVALAHAAQETAYGDDLTEIGGEEFSLSRATQHGIAGAAFTGIEDGLNEAEEELVLAISLYEEGPGPGEQHWFGGKALAGADLAVVRLRSGALDAAEVALEPVLALPPPRRVSALTTRLARVRDELAAPVFQGSPQARSMYGQIEEFSRQAVTSGLHSLSG